MEGEHRKDLVVKNMLLDNFQITNSPCLNSVYQKTAALMMCLELRKRSLAVWFFEFFCRFLF